MTLISILGDFHSSVLPIFFEFKDKIKKHIIIYDDSRYDQEQLKRLLSGQNQFLTYFEDDGKNLNFELISIKIDEDDYENILKTYASIIQSTKNPRDIYLNATDGLSSVSIVLSNNLLQDGANVLSYDRYANTYNIHTSEGMNKFKITNNIDIKNHLKLVGYNILGFTNRFELQNRKSIILKLTSDLTDYKSFIDLLQNTPIEYIKGFDHYKTLLASIDKLNDKVFIQGTVFEEYIYHLIKDNFDFDDVMTGVKVEFNTDFMNELDILMIKDNHLHTIECKFVNSLDGEHYVYKTNSIIDYLDNDGKAMILSIGADNVRVTKSSNKKVQFSKGTLARAKNGNIRVHQSKSFDETKFLADIGEWFGL